MIAESRTVDESILQHCLKIRRVILLRFCSALCASVVAGTVVR